MNENQNENQAVNQNYLVLAIVATILGCCSFYWISFILGIVAIVFAAQVNSKAKMGDYITANKYSDYAKKLSLAAIAITVISIIYIGYKVKNNPEIIEQIEQVREKYQEPLEEAKKEKHSLQDSYQKGYEEGQNKAKELLKSEE